MSHRGFILHISSNTTTAGGFFEKSAAMGFRPVLITGDPSRFSFLKEMDVETIRIDENDTEAVREFVLNFAWKHHVAGVMSTSEFFQGAAADLATLIGLPSRDGDALRRCRNKAYQRNQLKSSGVQQPRFWIVTCVEEAVAAFHECSEPVVIKPIDGSGSVGVCFADDVASVVNAASKLLGRATNERGMDIEGEILVEQCIEGPEFSIELFNLQVVGVTEKFLGNKPSFVEIGHTFPAKVSESEKEKLSQIALAASKTLNLESGPVHVEAKLVSGIANIVEVNGRLAGGHIPRLVELTGTDLISQTIALATGAEPLLPLSNHAAASIRFILPTKSGRLSGISGISDARSFAGVVEAQVYKQTGEQLSIWGDFRDRIGHVITAGSSGVEAEENAIAAHKLINLTITESSNHE